MIRVLIADDHPVVREGFRGAVEEYDDLHVVGEASTGEDTLILARQVEADVLLLDISMPGPGIETLLSELRSLVPELAVLVVSMYPEEQLAVRMLRSGAMGYLNKGRTMEELLLAIRQVHAGEPYVSETSASRLAEFLRPGSPALPEEALSHRELQVLRRLGRGDPVKRIALDLGISPKTVSTYRSRLREKLGIDSNAGLIRFAVERGLLD